MLQFCMFVDCDVGNKCIVGGACGGVRGGSNEERKQESITG